MNTVLGKKSEMIRVSISKVFHEAEMRNQAVISCQCILVSDHNVLKATAELVTNILISLYIHVNVHTLFPSRSRSNTAFLI